LKIPSLQGFVQDLWICEKFQNGQIAAVKNFTISMDLQGKIAEKA
jgi:hypothetical protein